MISRRRRGAGKLDRPASRLEPVTRYPLPVTHHPPLSTTNSGDMVGPAMLAVALAVGVAAPMIMAASG